MIWAWSTLKTDEPLSLMLRRLPSVAYCPALMERRSPVAVVATVGLQSMLAKAPEKLRKLAVDMTWKILPELKPVFMVLTESPVPEDRKLSRKWKAPEVVAPVDTIEVNVWVPVPELRLRVVAPVLLPREIDRVVASVPIFIFPVEVLPRVRVDIFVVARLPVPVR